MSNIPIPERKNWVGASEVASLLGVSPFKTRFALWMEKKGRIQPDNLDEVERIAAGRHLEPAIAAWASEKWRWELSSVGDYLEHPTVDRMGASLDFQEEADSRGNFYCPPIEIKNVDWLVFRDHWAAEGDEIIDAPIHYLIQAQHQLACRPQAPHGWLLACVGGNKLYRMQVERHDGLIERIESEVQAFWQSIDDDRPPAPDFNADAATIAKLYPASRGEWLDLSTHNRLPELVAEVTAGKAEKKAAEKRADAAMAEIKMLIGDAPGAIGPSGIRIKATDVKESMIEAHSRAGYRRWTITQKEPA